MKKTLTTMLALTLSISLLMVTESEAIAQKKGRSFGKSVQGRTAARSMQRRTVQQSQGATQKAGNVGSAGRKVGNFPIQRTFGTTKQASVKRGSYHPGHPRQIKPGLTKPGGIVAPPLPNTALKSKPFVNPGAKSLPSSKPGAKPGPQPKVSPNLGIKPLPFTNPGLQGKAKLALPKPNPGWTPKPLLYPNPHACIPFASWRIYRPLYCHWWYTWCPSIRVCRPVDCVVYDVCTVTIDNARWYLGLTGIVLPGKGLGLDAVDAGSPAALAGLKPGMAIVSMNDIELVDETSVANAIASSGGVLNMVVQAEAEAEPMVIEVVLRRLVVNKY